MGTWKVFVRQSTSEYLKERPSAGGTPCSTRKAETI